MDGMDRIEIRGNFIPWSQDIPSILFILVHFLSLIPDFSRAWELRRPGNDFAFLFLPENRHLGISSNLQPAGVGGAW